MKITISLMHLRAIASWQPVTKLAGDRTPVLQSVQFVVEDGFLTTTVTDRFRIVYSRREIDYAPDCNFTVPMSLIVQFLAGVKSVKNDIAPVDIETEGLDVSLSLYGTTIQDRVIITQYPDTISLYRQFTPDSATDNAVTFNMKLLADLPKFVNPARTSEKNEQWTMRKHANNNSWLFSTGDPEQFGVLIQAVLKK